eukprot:TRINITY_DN11807_c0_g1_i2.p2 TRINITY_DN11807_c0_g1~~TRINITY_DN11807_c0_g1_i2.p2  ORF type:complete len:119 (+),score=28.98 TRINITY_DN11807_c0_g1_i2:92-448(+)
MCIRDRYMGQLQTAFNASLAKLSEENTKELGMEELQAAISSHSSPQALRIYLKLISEGAKAVNTSGKELYVLLLGCIAKKYKSSMIDPIDSPASLEKTISRVCKIAYSYLNVHSRTKT